MYLLARQSADGRSFVDYYVIPAALGSIFPTALKIRNGARIDRFRVRELSAAIEIVMTFFSDT